MDISTALATVIKQNRNKLNISQEELAHRSNLDRTYISLLERSKRKPTINVIFSISTALNLSASQLIAEVEELVNS